MDGDYITLIFNALGYKCLAPADILYDTIMPAGTKSGGKHQHVIVAPKTSFHHCGEIAVLLTRLVDWNAKWGKSWQIHKQIIDKITESSIIVTAYNSTQRNTIFTTQGVVANKCIEAFVIRARKIVLPFNLQCHIQILDAFFEPIYANLVTTFPKKSVYLILMGNPLQPAHHKTRNEFCFRAHFALQDLINVDCLFSNSYHFSL